MLRRTYLHTPKTIRKKKLQIISRILIFTIAFFYPISQTFAMIDKDTLNFYSKNNILYYDPTGTENFGQCNSYASVLPSSDEITWIGDSYSVGAESIIKEKFSDNIKFYAQSSKFVLQDSTTGGQSGITILKNLITEQKITKYVIFPLGTNGGWTEAMTSTILKLAQNNNLKILLVTSKTPNNSYESSNLILQNFAKEYTDIIYLADWQTVYKEEFFSGDPEKIHPTSSGGYDAWVNLIYKTAQSMGPKSNEVIGGLGTGSNLDYEGNQIWSDAQLQAIENNKKFYIASAEKYNIPWQILAVLHDRENSLLLTNPANGQGPYQFYSSEERNACTSLNGVSFTPKTLTEDEFQKHTDCAASRLKTNYGLTDDLSDTAIKKVFFRYNGQADLYKNQSEQLGYPRDSGEGSPYVMNKADAQRDSNKNPNWQQIICDPGYHLEGNACIYGSGNRIGKANQSYGAFVLYAALGGSSAIVTCNNSLSAGGMTAEEAEAYMAEYRHMADINGYDWSENKYQLNSTDCPGLYNCVALSQYFIATNTTAGPAGGFPNGKDVVDYLVRAGRAESGTIPKPYAIFSTAIHSSNPAYGHTGVVLSVMEDKIIIGEAGCYSGSSGIKTREIPIETASDGSYTYAYLNDLSL